MSHIAAHAAAHYYHEKKEKEKKKREEEEKKQLEKEAEEKKREEERQAREFARRRSNQAAFLEAAVAGSLENLKKAYGSGIVGVNEKNIAGQTAVWLAAYHGHSSVINYLVSIGANINISDLAEQSPLFVAATAGYHSTVTILLHHKANMELKTKDGYTPLFGAAQRGHDKIVDQLLAVGANIDTSNGKDHKTALYEASIMGHDQAVAALLRYQANTVFNTPLFYAAQKGHHKVVEQLLIGGAKINTPEGKDDKTALHEACVKGHDQVIAVLLRHNANVELKDKEGHTALFYAVNHDHPKAVDQLLAFGANMNITINGFTPLNIASGKGYDRVVAVFLRYKANIELKDENNCTPLYCAAMQGRDKVVTQLLEAGAKINVPNTESGASALNIASYQGHDKVVDVLLYYADIEFAFKGGATSLDCAAQRGHAKIVDQLLAAGAKNNVGIAFHVAIDNGHDQVVAVFLRYQAIVELKKGDFSPLFCAVQKAHDKVVEQLLIGGAKIDLPNGQDDKTALHEACIAGHDQVVAVLLRYKANVELKDKLGFTPLFYAAQKGNGRVVDRLLAAGANIDALNGQDDKTALHQASIQGRHQVITVLLGYKANTELKTKDGCTPLFCAAQKGHDKIVDQLLAINVVNIDEPSTSGDTPLHVAAAEGHLEVVSILLRYHASVDKIGKSSSLYPFDEAILNNRTKVVSLLWQQGIRVIIDSRAPDLLANIFDQLAKILRSLGHLNECIACYQQQLKLIEKIHGEASQEVIEVLKNIGSAYESMPNTTEEDLNEKALFYFEQAYALADVQSPQNLALIKSLTGKLTHLRIACEQHPMATRVSLYSAMLIVQLRKLHDENRSLAAVGSKNSYPELKLQVLLLLATHLKDFYKEKRKQRKAINESREKVIEELLTAFDDFYKNQSSRLDDLISVVESIRSKITPGFLSFKGVQGSLLYQKLSLALTGIHRYREQPMQLSSVVDHLIHIPEWLSEQTDEAASPFTPLSSLAPDNALLIMHQYFAEKLQHETDKGRLVNFQQLLQLLQHTPTQQAVQDFIRQAPKFVHHNPLKGNRYHDLRQALSRLDDAQLDKKFSEYLAYLRGELIAQLPESAPTSLKISNDQLRQQLFQALSLTPASQALESGVVQGVICSL